MYYYLETNVKRHEVNKCQDSPTLETQIYCFLMFQGIFSLSIKGLPQSKLTATLLCLLLI